MLGVAERDHGVTNVVSRVLLLDSGSPKLFWPQAKGQAAALHNVLPPAKGRVSPYFALFQKLPLLKHFHPFGSYVVIHCDAVSKLTARGLSAIYLGVPSSLSFHGITYYAPTTNTIGQIVHYTVNKQIQPFKLQF